MATRKLPKEKRNRYLSLADRDFIGSYADEDNTDNTSRLTVDPVTGNVNQMSDVLNRQGRELVNRDLALGSDSQHPQPLTTNVVTNPLARNTPQDNIASALATQQPTASLSNLQLSDRVTRMNPLLFGQADVSRIARNLIAPDVTTPAVVPQPRAIQQRAPEQEPEDKLLAALAKTNPTPQSFWKRLLSGALQAGQGVTPQDTLGSAFGRIVGGAVTRAIPAIDTANLYEENKRKAIERYTFEKAAREAKLQRRKLEADITDTELRRQATIEQFKVNQRERALQDINRLRDDKRAEANQRLTVLEKLAEDSPKRDEIAEELRASYGVNVDASYGLLIKPQVEKPEKPLTESDIRRRAVSEVNAEIGASVEKIARDSTEVKMQKRRDELDRILADPNAGNVKKAQAREQYEKDKAAQLKVDLAYTKSDVESRYAKREQELRGSQPSPTKRSARQSRGKVVQSNEAKATNFMQPGKAYTLK